MKQVFHNLRWLLATLCAWIALSFLIAGPPVMESQAVSGLIWLGPTPLFFTLAYLLVRKDLHK